MSKIELKDCPFCGGKPRKIEGALTGRTLVECQANDCPLRGDAMLLDEWNRRCEPERTKKDQRQLGWYAPGSKRFCYTDEKEAEPESKRSYTVPVFVEIPAPAVTKGEEA